MAPQPLEGGVHCDQGRGTLRPGEGYIATRGGVHCDQGRGTLRPGEGYIATRGGVHCDQGRGTLRPGEGYIATLSSQPTPVPRPTRTLTNTRGFPGWSLPLAPVLASAGVYVKLGLGLRAILQNCLTVCMAEVFF